MNESQRSCYLDAMGIDTWELRAEPTTIQQQVPVPEPAQATGAVRLKLGPGKGGTLLICAADKDSATKLANDINRSLGMVPVWAWPDSEGTDTLDIESAVQEHLFTTIAIFGSSLAAGLFGENLPVSFHSSKLVLLPDMHELESQADARRAFWKVLCKSGMVVTH